MDDNEKAASWSMISFRPMKWRTSTRSATSSAAMLAYKAEEEGVFAAEVIAVKPHASTTTSSRAWFNTLGSSLYAGQNRRTTERRRHPLQVREFPFERELPRPAWIRKAIRVLAHKDTDEILGVWWYRTADIIAEAVSLMEFSIGRDAADRPRHLYGSSFR